MVEALVASAVMIVIMLAIARLVEQNKNYKDRVKKIEESVQYLNERGFNFEKEPTL
jgi:hypothetical protein